MKLEAPQQGRILTLNDFTTKEIKGFIQKYNNALKIKGYSKVYKKEGLISLINKHPLVEVVGNMNSVRFNVSGAQVKGMDMLYKFKPKKVVIKKMVKKKKVVEEKPKKEKAPPKPKKEKAPKKLLKFEIAWAEGKVRNQSQRALIAKMTDERREEVLKMLGLKKPKEKAPPKPKKEINCIKSLNNAKSVIDLYEKHKGILKNSDFKSQKDVNEIMKQIVLYMSDSRCSKEEKSIMKKAFDLQQNPPKKEKALSKANILDNEFKKLIEDNKKTLVSIKYSNNATHANAYEFYNSRIKSDRTLGAKKNLIRLIKEDIEKKNINTKEKPPPKKAKKPRTKAQIEATKKLVASNKAKKKKEVSVSFD